MDESWRMRMGIPTSSSSSSSSAAAARSNLPGRRSTEDISFRQSSSSGSPQLEPEDFKDVFGGPPRTVMSRQFSAGDDQIDFLFRRSSNSNNPFYEEIFGPMENNQSSALPVRRGRNLPEFSIPAEKGGGRKSNRLEGFFSDIFGWNEDEEKRSKSKSKTSSSSVLSSEDLSPLRPVIGIGVRDVPLFASNLRPINVPKRWNSIGEVHEEEHQQHQSIPSYPSNTPSYNAMEYEYLDNLRNSNYGCSQRNPSPETISIDQPNSFGSFNPTLDHDFELNSPNSSVVSSLWKTQEQEAMACGTDDDQTLNENDTEAEDDVMSSYVIEINGDYNQDGITDEAIGVDEAIAWAKEKFQTHCSAEISKQFSDEQKDDNESRLAPKAEEADHWLNAGEKQQLETKMEMEMWDEKIRLWSSGKEADIRLLLSTLHHVLWEDSGWLAVSLANLIQSSHVKKAYQKARLLLHPDKLQQRGATVLQKHVAKKAFPILQDAWSAFMSKDVF